MAVPPITPQWKSRRNLEDHFRRHGREVGARSVAAYDASAREVIEIGTYFEYHDPETAEWRVGYYDRPTGRLTVLNDDETVIVTHFRCIERYVADRPRSTYA